MIKMCLENIYLLSPKFMNHLSHLGRDCPPFLSISGSIFFFTRAGFFQMSWSNQRKFRDKQSEWLRGEDEKQHSNLAVHLLCPHGGLEVGTWFLPLPLRLLVKLHVSGPVVSSAGGGGGGLGQVTVGPLTEIQIPRPKPEDSAGLGWGPRLYL